MAEWGHVVCFHETVRNLVYKAKPRAHRADVCRCWEVFDGGNVLICWLDSLHCDLEPSELNRFAGKLLIVVTQHVSSYAIPMKSTRLDRGRKNDN